MDCIDAEPAYSNDGTGDERDEYSWIFDQGAFKFKLAEKFSQS